MPRHRWIFGGSVRKNLALHDCQATALLPVPTLAPCYLDKWQSRQPAQSQQLLLVLLTPGRCSRPVGRPGTPTAPPPQPGRAEGQKHSEIPKGTLGTQSDSHHRRICKKPVFAITPHWPWNRIIATNKHVKMLSMFSTWTNDSYNHSICIW